MKLLVHDIGHNSSLNRKVIHGDFSKILILSEQDIINDNNPSRMSGYALEAIAIPKILKGTETLKQSKLWKEVQPCLYKNGKIIYY